MGISEGNLPRELARYADLPVAEPVIHPETSGYWTELGRSRLVLQKCDDCETIRFPVTPVCHNCLSLRWAFMDVPAEGAINVAIRVFRPTASGRALRVPYLVGLVDIADLARVPSRILCDCGAALIPGEPVRAVLLTAESNISVPAYAHRCVTPQENP